MSISALNAFYCTMRSGGVKLMVYGDRKGKMGGVIPNPPLTIFFQVGVPPPLSGPGRAIFDSSGKSLSSSFTSDIPCEIPGAAMQQGGTPQTAIVRAGFWSGSGSLSQEHIQLYFCKEYNSQYLLYFAFQFLGIIAGNALFLSPVCWIWNPVHPGSP